LMKTAREDFSWDRPNRRYLHTGIHMPSMASEAAGVIAVGIDTSGSIDHGALEVFVGELQGIVDHLKPERVIVFACDTRIHGGRQVFEPGDLIEPKTPGGGGTEFAPVFDAVDEDEDNISCLIYFTDGGAAMPAEPTFPVLWAIQGSRQQHRDHIARGWANELTFGEVIYLEGGAR